MNRSAPVASVAPSLLRSGRPSWPIIVLFFVLFAVTAVRLGGDATPDFRIYHFYNGFAALHDRTKLDIAPAQMQTMFFNGLDAVNVLIFRVFDTMPTVINIILSVPYSLTAILLFALARIFFGRPGLLSEATCALVALFGLSGAGALPTLATTMTDITASVPMFAALAYWFWREKDERNSVRSAVMAGLLGGASVGLKLTTAPVFVGFFAVILLRRMFGRRTAIVEAVLFGACGVMVFFAIDATWLWHNWELYRNPIFPLMNDVFKSDYAAYGSYSDTRFFPKTLKMALFYPAYWTFRDSNDAIELTMRDGRVLVACLGALFVLAVGVARRLVVRRAVAVGADHLATYLAIIVLVSYGLWEVEWSIYRYLAIDECLSGVMLLAALGMAWRSAPRAWLTVGFVVIALPVAATTHYPWWSRAAPSDRAVSVSLPAIEPDAMIVLLDPYAYSYLVPFLPPSVRVIGANSNLVHPGSPDKLQVTVAAAINGDAGPLWGLQFPQAFPGAADATLKFYRLSRVPGSCQIVPSNIEDGPHIQLCRLLRAPLPH